MWILFRLIVLTLLPALVWSQALHQEKVGFYVASKAGADCSQATLTAADDAALALGQILVVPPNDRFGVPCQWVITDNITIDSPLFIPYDTTPVIKVNDDRTMTLEACPVVWGDYYIFDANEDTTGTVSYTPGCTQCVKSGANDWTQCPVSGGGGGGGGGGDITSVYSCTSGACDSMSVPDGGLLSFASLDPDSAGEGLILPQSDSCAAATALGQVCVEAETGVLFVGNGTGAVSAGIDTDDQTLQEVITAGRIVTTAVSPETAVEMGGATNRWRFYCDGSNICNQTTIIPTTSRFVIPSNFSMEFYDEEGAAVFLAFDPDAATQNGKITYGTAARPLVTSEAIIRPIGDCTVAEEAIVSGGAIDEWVTCVDQTGDGFDFSYTVINKLASDLSLKLTGYAVNKNTASAGTLTFQCAAQSVRPNFDVFLPHSTTGQQSLSFTFNNVNTTECSAASTPFACCTGAGTGTCLSHLEEASATITINGTVGVGA
jgi:hypothetical protein